MVASDGQAESAGFDLTREKMELFYRIKSSLVNDALIERIETNSDYISAKNAGDFVLFISNDCRACNRVFSVLSRYVAVKT